MYMSIYIYIINIKKINMSKYIKEKEMKIFDIDVFSL